ncbi:pyridoxamine 5'-phosphate oxidase family protein [Lentzea rhizosphaerae]|uniref:Pyridoxamine 5'-phosphate oxidase family protein n=1 Tax=Lentzea rhizosphaerae TaxID=2041025 RepID=A0ABV8C558_9PSEU
MTVAHELTNSECWDLLDRVSLGRLLYTSAGLPLAQPVRFVARNKVVLLSLDQCTVTRVFPAGFEFVAFQADDFVDGVETGHSVTVYGRAQVVSHQRRSRAEGAGLPSHEGKAVHACVAPTHLCGRQLDLRT